MRVDGLDTASEARGPPPVGFCFTDPDAQIVMPTVAEDIAFGLRRRRLAPAEIAARVDAPWRHTGWTPTVTTRAPALRRTEAAPRTGLRTRHRARPRRDGRPTTLLDLANTERIRTVVRGLAQQVVLVTHHLDLVDDFDRVIVFHGAGSPSTAPRDRRRALPGARAMSTASVYVPRDSPSIGSPRAAKPCFSPLSRRRLLWSVSRGRSASFRGLALALYAVARLPGRTALAQVRPVLWLLVALGVFQWLVDGWARAVVVVGVLLALVLLAALVSPHHADQRHRRRRCPALCTAAAVGRRARAGRPARGPRHTLGAGRRRACSAGSRRPAGRGLTASPVAFAVPLVVRSLRHADRLGEALVARGVED